MSHTNSRYKIEEIAPPAEGPWGVTTHPGNPNQATLIQFTHTGVHLYGWVPFQITTDNGSRVAWAFH